MIASYGDVRKIATQQLVMGVSKGQFSVVSALTKAEQQGFLQQLDGVKESSDDMQRIVSEFIDLGKPGIEGFVSRPTEWLGDIYSLVTVGSPIDKFIALWPSNYKYLDDAGSWPHAKIRHDNYCEEQDPVGHQLNLLYQKPRYQTCFERGEEMIYCRAVIPGQAHFAYFKDTDLFHRVLDRTVHYARGLCLDRASKVKWFSNRVPVLALHYLVLPLAPVIILWSLLTLQRDSNWAWPAIAFALAWWFTRHLIQVAVVWRRFAPVEQRHDVMTCYGSLGREAWLNEIETTGIPRPKKLDVLVTLFVTLAPLALALPTGVLRFGKLPGLLGLEAVFTYVTIVALLSFWWFRRTRPTEFRFPVAEAMSLLFTAMLVVIVTVVEPQNLEPQNGVMNAWLDLIADWTMSIERWSLAIVLAFWVFLYQALVFHEIRGRFHKLNG